MKKVILFWCIVSFFNCNKTSFNQSILTKIHSFESNESKFFREINIHLEREGGIFRTHKIFYANRNMRLDSNETYAIFNTKPAIEISKNFKNQPISEEFVLAFKELNCTKLFNMMGETYLKFTLNKNHYLLYRETKPSIQYLRNLKATEVKNNWYLIEF